VETQLETSGGRSEDRLVYTVAEAGELLGISRAFAYELVARGELPVIRLGRRRLVPKVPARDSQAGPLRRSDLGRDVRLTGVRRRALRWLWTSTAMSTQMSTPLVRPLAGSSRTDRNGVRQSGQGRRSRGVRRVGRRALTARPDSVDTMDLAGP
jgi:excisionase family DNA binding protein